MTTRKSMLKNIVSGCLERSEHHMDIVNAKSIGKKRLNVFITERFIEKTVSFRDSIKKFTRSQVAVLKNFAIFAGKHL